jgi:hypothetical protein
MLLEGRAGLMPSQVILQAQIRDQAAVAAVAAKTSAVLAAPESSS